MKTLTTSVACSECGKALKGTERLRGLGFNVRRHKRPDGKECWGSKRTDHHVVTPKAKREDPETKRFDRAVDRILNSGTMLSYMADFWRFVDGKISFKEFDQRMPS